LTTAGLGLCQRSTEPRWDCPEPARTLERPASQTGSDPARDEHELHTLLGRALPSIRPTSRAFLAGSARLRVLPAHQKAFVQGELIPLTLLIRGYGAFRRTTIDGRQLSVGVARPHDLFGFSSVVAGPTSVDLVALTEIEVALWRGPELRQLAATDPGFALDVIDRMAGFLNTLTEKLDGFMHQDARRRVVRILSRHRDLFFADPAILPRSELPSLVGTSREMTGRVLRELEREGVLTRFGRTGLRLLDPDRLDADAAPFSQDAS
jgi:CRP-like cAMP-binding protein